MPREAEAPSRAPRPVGAARARSGRNAAKGVSVIVLIVLQGYKLNLWDVGWQKSLRTYWRNYFEQTDALVFMFCPLPPSAPEHGGAGVGCGLRGYAAARRLQG